MQKKNQRQVQQKERQVQEKEPDSVGPLEVHKTAHDETVGETSEGEAGVAADTAWAMWASCLSRLGRLGWVLHCPGGRDVGAGTLLARLAL